MATPQKDPESGIESPSSAPAVESRTWLTDSLARAVNGHDANDEEETTAALVALCDAARSASMPIEGILVPLKQQWQARTASNVPLRTGPTEDRLARLVSACISVYYRRN